MIDCMERLETLAPSAGQRQQRLRFHTTKCSYTLIADFHEKKKKKFYKSVFMLLYNSNLSLK